MAAGLGLKTFVTGDVLTAADTNGYLMQGVWVFASAAARSAAVTSPQEGNFSFLKDTNSTEYYDGAAWVAVAGGASAYTGAKVILTASQSISNNVDTVILWPAEVWDTSAIHDNTTNTGRLTVPTGKTGYWELNVNLTWAATATGAKTSYVYKNGTGAELAYSFVTYTSAASLISVSYTYQYYLTAGDYIHVVVAQNSGGALNLQGGSASSTNFTTASFSYLGA
jgi:hypothetical protein